MKPDTIECLIFDIGGTINGPSFGGMDFLKYFLKEAGLLNGDKVTPQKASQAQKKASNWLNSYMIENNVGAHWEMSHTERVRYSQIILDALDIDESPRCLAEVYEKKREIAVEELGASLADECGILLKTLSKRNYRIGIASNRFGNPMSYFRRHNLAAYFEAIEFTLVPGYRKPSPYMLLTVAEELSTNPLKCAYIGDTIKYDITAAHRASMLPILTAEFKPPSEARQSSEWLTISKLSDLLDIFKSAE